MVLHMGPELPNNLLLMILNGPTFATEIFCQLLHMGEQLLKKTNADDIEWAHRCNQGILLIVLHRSRIR
jgi:hypothetical protein